MPWHGIRGPHLTNGRATELERCPTLLCKRRRPRPKSGLAEDGDSSSQPGGRHQLSMVCGKSTLGSTKHDAISDDPCSQEAFLGDLAHVIANVTSHAHVKHQQHKAGGK